MEEKKQEELYSEPTVVKHEALKDMTGLVGYQGHKPDREWELD